MPYQVPITVDSISEDITKFYLVVKLILDPSHVTTPTFAFTDAFANPLASHLVSYDSGTGQLDTIVKTPLLAAGTTIYVTYS